MHADWLSFVRESAVEGDLLPLDSLRRFGRVVGWPADRLVEISAVAPRYYHPFHRRKVAGKGKWRHIDRPTGDLLDVQRSLQRRLLGPLQWPDEILGGVRGRSIRDNAKMHVRQPMVVTLDLANCFPRISHSDVHGRLRDLGFGRDVASVITKLTTVDYHLPQGAPTSTLLANLVLLPMFERIRVLAESSGLVASFWVDDIVLSGEGAERAIEPVIKIVQAHGQSISSKKKRLMPLNLGPQFVTGAVVNRGVSAGSDRVTEIREQILELQRLRDVPDRFIRSVWGKIAMVAYLRPAQADSLRRMAERRLPEFGYDAELGRKDEVRDCNCPRRWRRPR